MFIILGLYLIGIFFNLGLMVPAREYGETTLENKLSTYSNIPKNLPTPVYNYLQKSTSAKVPAAKSAVVWGRAKIKYSGSWAQVRFKSSYLVGSSYLNITEVTWFGFPVTKIIESFNGTKGLYKIGSAFITGNEVDHDNQLSLWSNGLWMPSLYLNPNLWYSKSSTEAILDLPNCDTKKEIIYKFDKNNLVSELVAKKYKYGKKQTLTKWRLKVDSWSWFQGVLLPAKVSLFWESSQKPWAIYEIEGVVYQDGIGLWKLDSELESSL